MLPMSSDTPLQKCPRCRYSLTGLPDIHRCPECAFEYDKRMVVIEQSAKLSWFLVGMYSVGALMWTSYLAATSSFGWGSLILTVFWFATFLGARQSIRLRNRSKALLWPDGLILLPAQGDFMYYASWDDVSRVEYDRLGGGAKLLAHDGSTLHAVPYDFFGSGRISKEFIAAANRIREQYLTEEY